MKRKILLIACLLLCLSMLAACGKKQAEQNENISIETVYGTLVYPEQWKEFAQITQQEENGVVSVSFSAAFEGENYPLFTVRIGGTEGTYVGQITDDSGKSRDVLVTMEKLPETDELSENEMDRLYAMQEDLNYIIEKLK